MDSGTSRFICRGLIPLLAMLSVFPLPAQTGVRPALAIGNGDYQGSIVATALKAGRVFVDGDLKGRIEATGELAVSGIPSGETEVEFRYDDGTREAVTALVFTGSTVRVEGRYPELPGNFVFVPGGSFAMRSRSVVRRDDYDEVRYPVTVSSFAIGEYEVTQREWVAVMGSNPSDFNDDDLPVEQVSWFDAVDYCNKLSAREGLTPAYAIEKTDADPNPGSWSPHDSVKWVVSLNQGSKGYRLPTEAEWEYAARGGSEGIERDSASAGSEDTGDVAWFGPNSGDITHRVGRKKPNALGLYDMSGNVGEWCWDWDGSLASMPQTDPTGPASGIDRVARGGSWADYLLVAGSPRRCVRSPDSRENSLGLRLVLPCPSPSRGAALDGVPPRVPVPPPIPSLRPGDNGAGTIIAGALKAGLVCVEGDPDPKGRIKARGELALSGIQGGETKVQFRYDDGSREEVAVLVSAGSAARAEGKYPKAPRGLVYVPGGSFTMGDATGGGKEDERPPRQVTVSSFFIGEHEVTQKEWLEVMGSTPGVYLGDAFPVKDVSWYEAVKYCFMRSVAEGLTPAYTLDTANSDTDNDNRYDSSERTVTVDWNANGYRLPTEAEWEYAARGGPEGNERDSPYAGSANVDEVAWYQGNSEWDVTHPVGLKKANALGTYDMSGNVMEWCWDWYGSYPSGTQADPTGPSTGGERVLRGGCMGDDAVGVRSSSRYKGTPAYSSTEQGLRIVRR